MQGSRQDSFQKTQKANRSWDDGSKKNRNSKGKHQNGFNPKSAKKND